jgi:RNA polymerase sigma-70 factor (ECF subfamily)
MENLTMARNQVKLGLEDEAALVEAARRDPAAFSELYRHYVTPVYRYFYRRLGNTRDAEDLASQVFMEALEGLVRYQERGNFAAWLFTIAQHKAIQAFRRQRPTLSLDEIEKLHSSADDPLEQLVQDENIEQMAAVFADLDEGQRELLRLRFTAGLAYADIGSLLGRTEAAVKMSVHRLLHQMYKKWEEK